MYEWLKDYQELQQKIDYLEYKIEREQRELGRWTSGDLIKTRLTEGSIASGIEERLEIMENELTHLKGDLSEAKKLIGSFEGLENKILYGRYVEGKKLIDIAFDLDKSPNYIYNKHAQIMKMIDYAVEFNLS